MSSGGIGRSGGEWWWMMVDHGREGWLVMVDLMLVNGG